MLLRTVAHSCFKCTKCTNERIDPWHCSKKLQPLKSALRARGRPLRTCVDALVWLAPPGSGGSPVRCRPTFRPGPLSKRLPMKFAPPAQTGGPHDRLCAEFRERRMSDIDHRPDLVPLSGARMVRTSGPDEGERRHAVIFDLVDEDGFLTVAPDRCRMLCPDTPEGPPSSGAPSAGLSGTGAPFRAIFRRVLALLARVGGLFSGRGAK